MNPDGNYYCGPTDDAEDFYCKEGLVLIDGKCLSPTECGCKLKELGIIIGVNQTKSVNCTHSFTCEKSQSEPSVITKEGCGEKSICGLDENNNPKCVCKTGLIGDGINCQGIFPNKIKKIFFDKKIISILQ